MRLIFAPKLKPIQLYLPVKSQLGLIVFGLFTPPHSVNAKSFKVSCLIVGTSSRALLVCQILSPSDPIFPVKNPKNRPKLYTFSIWRRLAPPASEKNFLGPKNQVNAFFHTFAGFTIGSVGPVSRAPRLGGLALAKGSFQKIKKNKGG